MTTAPIRAARPVSIPGRVVQKLPCPFSDSVIRRPPYQNRNSERYKTLETKTCAEINSRAESNSANTSVSSPGAQRPLQPRVRRRRDFCAGHKLRRSRPLQNYHVNSIPTVTPSADPDHDRVVWQVVAADNSCWSLAKQRLGCQIDRLSLPCSAQGQVFASVNIPNRSSLGHAVAPTAPYIELLLVEAVQVENRNAIGRCCPKPYLPPKHKTGWIARNGCQPVSLFPRRSNYGHDGTLSQGGSFQRKTVGTVFAKIQKTTIQGRFEIAVRAPNPKGGSLHFLELCRKRRRRSLRYRVAARFDLRWSNKG